MPYDHLELEQLAWNKSTYAHLDLKTGALQERWPANPKLDRLRVFLFDGEAYERGVAVHDATWREMAEADGTAFRLDLPFEAVWVETLDNGLGEITLPYKDKGRNPEAPKHFSFNVSAFAACEYESYYQFEIVTFPAKEGPGPFPTLGEALLQAYGDQFVDRLLRDMPDMDLSALAPILFSCRVSEGDYPNPSVGVHQLVRLTQSIFAFARSSAAAHATSAITRRIKLGKRRGISRRLDVSEIVHIARKSHREAYVPPSWVGELEWSHRWEVMGHWRRIKGVGKDRHGKRCVNGATWVRPHEKGAPGIEATRKTRRVHE